MSPVDKPTLRPSTLPLVLGLCLLGTFVYGEFAFYPALKLFHISLSQPLGMGMDVALAQERHLTVLAILVLVSTCMLAMSVNAVFTVHLDGTPFLRQFKKWLLALVIASGLFSLIDTLTVIYLWRHRGVEYLTRSPGLLQHIEAMSLVASLAITALAFSRERPRWHSTAMTSHLLALMALWSALQTTKVAYAYLAPVCLVSSWVGIALWIRKPPTQAGAPPADAALHSQ